MGKFFDSGLCIYLDQYAVSNIVSQSSSVWITIGELIEKGVADSRIIVPYSFEHVLETSRRDFTNALKQDEFLFKLSRGLSLKLESDITSNIIANRIRNSPNRTQTYFEKKGFNYLNDASNYNKLKALAEEFEKRTQNAAKDINWIRGIASEKPKIKPDIQVGMIDFIRLRDQNHLTSRLDSFAKTGNFERKYLDFSGISIPHWADVLLDILIDKYRITTQEAETGYELIIKYGLMIIPTIYVRSSLEGIAGTKQQKEDMGDHIDLMRLSTAIPSADIILTDKARVFDLKQLKFNEEFQVDIYSGAASDLTRFKLKLQEILQ